VGNTSDWDYGGGSPHSFTSSSDSSAPAQVANLAGSSSRTLVGLSWDANTEADLAYYEIQRADDSGGSAGAYSTIAQAKLNFYIDQDFTDGEVSAQDTFWYRVRAVDTSGNQGSWATEVDVSLGQITTDHIAANTIVANNIAANTITASEIAANTITASEIAASTITATELDVSQLSAIAADMGTLTAGEIQVGSGAVGTDFTGFRIFSTYIGGFNNDVFQAGIRSSDGKIVAGAGKVVMDADGLHLEAGTSGSPGTGIIDFEYGSRIYEWTSGSPATLQTLQLYAYSLASRHTRAELKAERYQLGVTESQRVVYVRANTSDQKATLYAQTYGVTHTAYLDPDIFYVEKIICINETENGEQTVGITINQGSNDDEIMSLKSSEVAHGITNITETDTWFYAQKLSGGDGGANLVGLVDDATSAISVTGISISDDTTKTTSARGVVEARAYKKDGAGITSPGSNANLFVILSSSQAQFIFDEEGSAHANVEWTTFDEHDDVSILENLERSMLAWHDPIKAQFAGMLQERHRELESLGIVTFDRDNPGRAMLNLTRLSMLLTGAVRQVAGRVERLEQALPA
jgi:hypothetical protein